MEVQTNLVTRQSARDLRFEPTGTNTATNVQKAIEAGGGGGGGGSPGGSSGQVQYNLTGAFAGAAALLYAAAGSLFIVNALAATDVPLTVRGVGSQSGNLVELHNSGDTVLAAFTASGQFLAAAGSVSLPGLAILGDTNTGMYAIAGDNLGVAVGGVNALNISATGTMLPASAYLNWGAAAGTGGYGVRDNAGTIEFKNSGGSWTGLGLAALTSAHIFVGNGSNIATDVAMSGDVTISNTGVTAIGSAKVTNAMLAGSIDLTTKVTGDLPFANLAQGTARSVLGVAGNATADVASVQSSATGQIFNSTATTIGWTATPVLGNAGTTVGTLGFQNATSGTITLSPVTGALGSVTLSLPAATDTLVGKATTDELTNKTLTSSVGKGTWTASGTWTLPALTLGGTVSGGGNQINNVVIGTSTPLAGSFTNVTASSTIFGAGTATLAYSFIGDTDTGMFSAGADTLNLQTGGTSRFQITSAGGFPAPIATVNAALLVSPHNIRTIASAGAANWNDIELASGSVTIITGTTTMNAVARVGIFAGTLQHNDAASNTITLAEGLYVEPPTAGTGVTIQNNFAARFAGSVYINAGEYINFSGTKGSSGYGIRDNSGTIQVSNSGGSWTNVLGGSSGITIGSTTIASGTTQRLLYDNAGAVGETTNIYTDGTFFSLGDSTQRAFGTTNATWQLNGTSSGAVQMGIGGYASASGFASVNNAGQFAFYRSRSGTVGTATVVSGEDILGSIRWIGAQQTSTFATQTEAARIMAVADGTVTSGASADMPGRLVFMTTPDGSGTVTERMRIDNQGNVIIGNVAGGAALATSATDGFLYIPTCAGAPTGNSTDYTGFLPFVYDSTNNKLMVNTSGTTWKGVVLS